VYGILPVLSREIRQIAVHCKRLIIIFLQDNLPLTVKQLVKHYKDNELPCKAHSTRRTVETTLNVWVVPKWGEHRLSDVRPVEVESWLHGLSLANATRAKVRNVMHGIFAHAGRHEWL